MSTRTFPGMPMAVSIFLSSFLAPFAMDRAQGHTQCPCFIEVGDANADHVIDGTDAVHIINFLFNGQPYVICANAADADRDGTLGFDDVNLILALNVPDEWVLCRGTGTEDPFLYPPLANSPCGGQSVTSHALLINHLAENWEYGCNGKEATDGLVTGFKADSLPVVYIVSGLQSDPDSSDYWETEDRAPTCEIWGSNGNYTRTDLKVDTTEVTLVGGYFNYANCYQRAFYSTLESFHGGPLHGSVLQINVPMDAIFLITDFEPPDSVYSGPLLRDNYLAAEAGKFVDYGIVNGYDYLNKVVFPTFVAFHQNGRYEFYVDGLYKTTKGFTGLEHTYRVYLWTTWEEFASHRL